jgi:hypothetical protein
MHYKIRYHNKPHDLKLSNVHIVPLGKGILLVTCELNLRGYEIDYHGGRCEGDNWKRTSHSVYFGDDSTIPPSKQEMRAELTLYPDKPEEACMALQVDSMSKTTYRCIMVSRKCLDKKWAEYEKDRIVMKIMESA